MGGLDPANAGMRSEDGSQKRHSSYAESLGIVQLARDTTPGGFEVHPAEARAGVERGGHADSNWSCVLGLQTGRSACPPACCITPSASAATTTPAPTTGTARRSSPSTRSLG